jgi:hypothetical protein
MAAIIYMEQTLALIHSTKGPKAVHKIVQSGVIKQTESGIRYLLITEEDDTEQEG